MKSLLSDNTSGVHHKIMAALIQANEGHSDPYGEDEITYKAREIIAKNFGCFSNQIHFVMNGTGANVISNATGLRSFESLVTTDIAHINGPETGAFENFSGSRILTIPHKNGKFTIDNLMKMDDHLGDIHYSQIRMISITQMTEIGTVYTLQEIKTIADFMHKNGWLLHVDGARIANAAVSLGVSFKEMITDTGVDVLSFGGTKNGLMFGEAIICLNKDMNHRMAYMVKHGNQLISKMRFTSAQFITYFQEKVWEEAAVNANAKAKLLENALIEDGFSKFNNEVQGNIVLISLPESIAKVLVKNNMVHEVTYNDEKYCRFVTSFDTTNDDISEVIKIIKENRK